MSSTVKIKRNKLIKKTPIYALVDAVKYTYIIVYVCVYVYIYAWSM